jgi:hypothetical protein
VKSPYRFHTTCFTTGTSIQVDARFFEQQFLPFFLWENRWGEDTQAASGLLQGSRLMADDAAAQKHRHTFGSPLLLHGWDHPSVRPKIKGTEPIALGRFSHFQINQRGAQMSVTQ